MALIKRKLKLSFTTEKVVSQMQVKRKDYSQALKAVAGHLNDFQVNSVKEMLKTDPNDCEINIKLELCFFVISQILLYS